MRVYSLMLLSAAFVVSCKLPISNKNENSSEAKELITGGDGNYFRYWIEGKGDDAKVFRAECPDKKSLTIETCKQNPQSISKSLFDKNLSKFLYTDNIPYLESQIQLMTKQLADPNITALERPDIEAGKKFYEDALAYSKELATKSDAVTGLIGDTKLEVHDLSSNDPKLASYRLPEYFLGKVFQTAGASGAIVKAKDYRLIDFTHTGGSLNATFENGISSPLADNRTPPKKFRCVSAGKITDYASETEEPIAKDQAPACCVLTPDTTWKLEQQKDYGFVAEASSRCNRCVTLRFKAKDSPALTCNFGVERDLATVTHLKTTLASFVAEVGAMR